VCFICRRAAGGWSPRLGEMTLSPGMCAAFRLRETEHQLVTGPTRKWSSWRSATVRGDDGMDHFPLASQGYRDSQWIARASAERRTGPWRSYSDGIDLERVCSSWKTVGHIGAVCGEALRRTAFTEFMATKAPRCMVAVFDGRAAGRTLGTVLMRWAFGPR